VDWLGVGSCRVVEVLCGREGVKILVDWGLCNFIPITWCLQYQCEDLLLYSCTTAYGKDNRYLVMNRGFGTFTWIEYHTHLSQANIERRNNCIRNSLSLQVG
jgi:hypothetical protein